VAVPKIIKQIWILILAFILSNETAHSGAPIFKETEQKCQKVRYLGRASSTFAPYQINYVRNKNSGDPVCIGQFQWSGQNKKKKLSSVKFVGVLEAKCPSEKSDILVTVLHKGRLPNDAPAPPLLLPQNPEDCPSK
jgi:hypothetical protein